MLMFLPYVHDIVYHIQMCKPDCLPRLRKANQSTAPPLTLSPPSPLSRRKVLFMLGIIYYFYVYCIFILMRHIQLVFIFVWLNKHSAIASLTLHCQAWQCGTKLVINQRCQPGTFQNFMIVDYSIT